MSGVNVRLPEDPRSRISSFAPARNSPPNLKACVPRDQDSESSICVSRIGVWKRATAALPSDAYPGMVNAGNAWSLTPLSPIAPARFVPRPGRWSMNLRRRYVTRSSLTRLGAEDVRVRARQALHADVGGVGQRIRHRIAVASRSTLVPLLLM